MPPLLLFRTAANFSFPVIPLLFIFLCCFFRRAGLVNIVMPLLHGPYMLKPSGRDLWVTRPKPVGGGRVYPLLLIADTATAFLAGL